MTLKSLLILFLFISVNCNAQKDKIVLINKNDSWNRSSFSYWTPSSTISITFHEIMGSIRVDKSKYVIDVPTQEPLFFNFSWNFKFQIVCLFPGDTLEFLTTSSDSLPFQFGGTRPYDELMFNSLLEVKRLGVLSGNQEVEVTQKLNYQYVADQSLERHNKRMSLLNELATNGKVSERGSLVISQSLYYRYLNELLFPYQAWKPLNEIVKTSIFVPNSYKAKLRDLEIEFNNDSLIYLLDYRRFILQYARFLMFETSGVEKIDLPSLLNFYKKTFYGKKRDLLLYDETIFNYRLSGDVSPITEVLDSIENQVMRDTLVSIQRKSKKEFSRYALEAEVETPTGEKKMIKELLTHSSKLIYIDFWATWCAPCIMEMPDSKKLTQEFKKDSIEFVYLSIDADKDKWLKKITALTTGGNARHYRLTDGERFIKEMQISSVPRYILIGKDGKMISFNAPRPRSAEIRELILENIRINK